MAWPAIAAGIGVASLITNYIGSRKASKAAKKQGAEEARIEGLITDEKLRQLDIEERAQYGQTLGQYAGSGVLGTFQGTDGNAGQPMMGSPKTILDEQAREFGRERDITREVGASNVAQTLMGAKALSDQYRYSGYANVASSISNIMTNYQLTK